MNQNPQNPFINRIKKFLDAPKVEIPKEFLDTPKVELPKKSEEDLLKEFKQAYDEDENCDCGGECECNECECDECDECEEELDEYTEELLDVATDEESALADGKIIFQRDPSNPNRLIMTALIDDILPDDIDDSGNEMWEGEIIVRLNKGYGGAIKKLPTPKSAIFRKSNWSKSI